MGLEDRIANIAIHIATDEKEFSEVTEKLVNQLASIRDDDLQDKVMKNLEAQVKSTTSKINARMSSAEFSSLISSAIQKAEKEKVTTQNQIENNQNRVTEIEDIRRSEEEIREEQEFREQMEQIKKDIEDYTDGWSEQEKEEVARGIIEAKKKDRKIREIMETTGQKREEVEMEVFDGDKEAIEESRDYLEMSKFFDEKKNKDGLKIDPKEDAKMRKKLQKMRDKKKQSKDYDPSIVFSSPEMVEMDKERGINIIGGVPVEVRKRIFSDEDRPTIANSGNTHNGNTENVVLNDGTELVIEERYVKRESIIDLARVLRKTAILDARESIKRAKDDKDIDDVIHSNSTDIDK